jgi:hypothetical protein
MRVNAGGDPGRDDYGLPPVDIEVPDDARDLARDVQAYHRELRSRRRRTLARRVLGPLTRDGMVLPLLAGCLALTLIAATLLTVATARQGAVSLRPGAGQQDQADTAADAAALLNATVFEAGQPVVLSTLPGPVLVLALVPATCRRCLTDLRELTVEASTAQLYLVGVRGTPVGDLTAQLGLGAAHGVEDSANTLPARYQVTGLTAVLVRTDGSAIEVIPDQDGFNIEQKLRALLPPSMASATGPSATGPSATGPSATGAPATPSPGTGPPATASPASTPVVTPAAAVSAAG